MGVGRVDDMRPVLYHRVAATEEVIVPIGEADGPELVTVLFTARVTTLKLRRLARQLYVMAKGFEALPRRKPPPGSR